MYLSAPPAIKRISPSIIITRCAQHPRHLYTIKKAVGIPEKMIGELR
jgi:hypothetical protein